MIGMDLALHEEDHYHSYITILGTKGKISVDKYIEKKYLENNGKASGYITGLQMANKYGFTVLISAKQFVRRISENSPSALMGISEL